MIRLVVAENDEAARRSSSPNGFKLPLAASRFLQPTPGVRSYIGLPAEHHHPSAWVTLTQANEGRGVPPGLNGRDSAPPRVGPCGIPVASWTAGFLGRLRLPRSVLKWRSCIWKALGPDVLASGKNCGRRVGEGDPALQTYSAETPDCSAAAAQPKMCLPCRAPVQVMSELCHADHTRRARRLELVGHVPVTNDVPGWCHRVSQPHLALRRGG